jgi:hypothetical protein
MRHKRSGHGPDINHRPAMKVDYSISAGGFCLASIGGLSTFIGQLEDGDIAFIFRTISFDEIGFH